MKKKLLNLFAVAAITFGAFGASNATAGESVTVISCSAGGCWVMVCDQAGCTIDFREDYIGDDKQQN